MKVKFLSLRLRKDDAGEEAGGGSETIGTNNDARVKLLNQIGDSNDGVREDELANVNDDDTTEPFKAERSKEDEEIVPEGTIQTEDTVPPEDTPPPEPVQKVKIKVNGKEMELTQEELIARAQKVESADQYLAEAKKSAKPVVADPPTGPSKEELQRLSDEEDRALVRAIQMGTEEEATAAIRKLKTQATSARPSLTQDDVSRTIDERLAFTRAIETYRSEFEDIVKDPYLNKLALDRDSELLAQGDTRSYIDRYREIGNELRTWKGTLVKAPETPTPTTTTLKDKETRKAAAPKVPVTASAKTTPPAPEDDDDETPHDVIQSMAKSRGGPQWMRG
jgi:hypothetical protein